MGRFRFLTKVSVITLMIFLAATSVKAQKGWQVSVQGMGGLGLISPQNHYDNPYYELDYKYKMGFGAQLYGGYNFNNSGGLVLATGYQVFNQTYQGQFSPGLGVGQQVHQKDIQLNYLNVGVLAKYATSFKDAYVLDTKAKMTILSGFVVGKLMKANMEYVSNGEVVAYPSKLIPYPATNYPYAPVTDDKDLFTDWNLSFVLNVGADIFIIPSLAISPSIQGQISLLDVNQKDYREHDSYKASRTIFGGLNVGLTYYINSY